MRILIVSHLYAPSIGGSEAVAETLAREFSAAGHEVKIATQTPGPDCGTDDGRVVRKPDAATLVRLVRWADLIFHNNISLRMLWPLLLVRRPWVIGHQTWLTRTNGRLAWQDHLKRFAVRYATNVANSAAVAGALPVSCTVIGNPYRDDLFVEDTATPRPRNIAFVGRLVSDKGADLLIEAVAELTRRHVKSDVTIIGSGPDEAVLRAQVERLGLSQQIRFAGALRDAPLVRELNAHVVLAVPSRWREPFGIVALEGIACGCVVVGSSDGGLAEAIGPCGITFPNGDAIALADALERAIRDEALRSSCRAAAPRHLAKYRGREVAAAYLRVMTGAANHVTT